MNYLLTILTFNKMDTINRLLKKQAPKRRGRAPGLATTAADAGMTDAGGGSTSGGGDAQNNAGASTSMFATSEAEMGSALYVRWINSQKGSVLAVPQEWLDAPVGKVFKANGQRAPAAKAST